MGSGLGRVDAERTFGIVCKTAGSAGRVYLVAFARSRVS